MATTILGIVREGKIVPQTALPDGLQVQITVPEEVVIPEEVATAMTEQAELPDELSLELAGLEHLDDEALWQAARSRLAAVMARRTEKLHQKRQHEGLTGAEALSPRRTVTAIRTGDADPRLGRSLVEAARP